MDQFMPDYNIRRQLALKLNLEFNDSMQDWEWEVAEANRIQDFLDEYDKNVSSAKEKETPMEIILQCLEDFLEEENLPKFISYYPEVKSRLDKNFQIHKCTIAYWKNGEFMISKELGRIKIR